MRYMFIYLIGSRSQINCTAVLCTCLAYRPTHWHVVVNLYSQTMINKSASFARVPCCIQNLVLKNKKAVRNSIITLLLPVTEHLANRYKYICCCNCHPFTIIQLWSWCQLPVKNYWKRKIIDYYTIELSSAVPIHNWLLSR